MPTRSDLQLPTHFFDTALISLATGKDLGTFDSEADVALCLAFARVTRNQVEVLCNCSPMASYTTWT